MIHFSDDWVFIDPVIARGNTIRSVVEVKVNAATSPTVAVVADVLKFMKT